MFKKILSVATLILMVFAVYKTFFSPIGVTIDDAGSYALAIGDTEPDAVVKMWEVTWHSFRQMNVWILLFMIPVQAALFYSAGQIYFAFLSQRKEFKMSRARLMRISLEINFVNQALPSGGASGLAYLMWRLKELKVTAGQVGFVHGLRYAICVLANTVQTLIAVAVVLIFKKVRPEGSWAVWMALIIAICTQIMIFLLIFIASRRKAIDWLSRFCTGTINRVICLISFGKRKNLIKKGKFERFFGDLHADYLQVRQKRNILWRPVLWGIIYSSLEIMSYWVVGIALGHAEILPQIMLAEGAAGAVATIWPTPGGVGGYEGTMILVMYMGGADLSIATITVIATRLCVIGGTFLSGWGFYQRALMSREDKFNIEERIKN